MSRIVSVFTFALALSLVSCSGENPEQELLAPIESPEKYASDKGDDFNNLFNKILKSLAKKDRAELSKYVSPEFGLLVIRADGALPNILIGKIDSKEYKACLETLFSSVPDSVTLVNESLPRVDCNTPSFYTKTGFFVRDTNLLLSSDIWKFGGLNEEDQKFVEKATSSVGRTVMLVPGLTFLFTYHQNTWYLSMVDLRKPCNA